MAEFRIAIADDDEDDFLLLKQAFDQSGEKHMLVHLKDGQQLIDYLYNKAMLREKLPDLIILDINMPRMDGTRTLELIRATKLFLKVPVVMHSTCGNVETKTRCRILGDNGFSVKAMAYPKIVTFARRINLFLRKLESEPGCRFDEKLLIEKKTL